LPYAIDCALSERFRRTTQSSEHDWALPYAIDFALSERFGAADKTVKERLMSYKL
jgi:hypothetical protein